MTRDGERTDDPERLYPELFALARSGLRYRGLTDARIDELLAPVERRRTTRTTPATWKRDRVRSRLDDGDGPEAAITGMQREYIRRAETGEPFVRWLR